MTSLKGGWILFAISVNRLAGPSHKFGPVIAFVFFLNESGGLLVDGADVSDGGGITLGFGRFIFALGFSTKNESTQIVSPLAVFITLPRMFFFMMAVLDSDGREPFVGLERLWYVLPVVWHRCLGWGLMNRPHPDLRQQTGYRTFAEARRLWFEDPRAWLKLEDRFEIGST